MTNVASPRVRRLSSISVLLILPLLTRFPFPLSDTVGAVFARLTWIVLHLFIGVPLHLDIGSTVCPTSVCARDKSTLEYCSGASPATKIDKSKCFKTVQACPDEYPGIPGTAMGIPGRFLVMQRWVKQDFSVGAGNGTGGECMPESEPNFRYAIEDGVCLPMLWPRNNRFWLVDVGAQVLKSDCHDAGCTKCPTLQKLDQLAGFSAKKGSFGICTAHVDASGAMLWSSAYISGDPKDKTSDAPYMYSQGASSKILPVVVAGAMAALLRDMHA